MNKTGFSNQSSSKKEKLSNFDREQQQNSTTRSNMTQDVSQSGAQKNRLQSPDFFKMSGMPKFGKQWLDNFIEDPELQNTFVASEVVRIVLLL